MIKTSFQGKTFILVIPNDFSIYEIFNDNLEKFGFNLISIVPQDFKYRSTRERVFNFFHKIFSQNKSYKQKLIKKFHSENIEAKINHLEEDSVDYVLVIRPDIVEKDTLNKLFKIGKKVVAYQWDGLDRFPKVFDCIRMFEKFLIFDQQDYDKYKSQHPNLQKCENFYFDFDYDYPINENSDIVYYIGAYYENRMAELILILRELEKYAVKFDINLRNHSSTIPKKEKNIKFFKEYTDFRTNLSWMKNAKVLLDFKVEEHNGLSLRFFEALKYNKKIITNNKTVLDFDFYDPQNIFILHHDDLNKLGDFLQSEYRKVPDEIVDQYSFSSWLNKYVI